MEVGSKNLSNNEVASGNFSQNTLVSFDGIFNGLEKTIGLFFPSIRNAMVERYRAETTLKIGLKAQEITQILGIEARPIPPKAALPLFDKLSLEHEEDMYDMWAKLLVATSDGYNPIQMQYSEILSKIGQNEAKLLYDIYKFQKQGVYSLSEIEDILRDYNAKCLIADAADKISENLRIGDVYEADGDYYWDTNDNIPEVHINVSPPEKTPLYDKTYTLSNYANNETAVSLLEQLKLVKKINDENDVFLMLTEYGYNFVDTLERYSIDKATTA